MIRMDGDERRARLARRHHLAAGTAAAGPEAAARSLIAVHSTDPASSYLALLARTNASTATIEQALYDDRSLVRMLGMRRTVFIVPVSLAPIIHAACTRAIAARERRKLVQLLEDTGIATNGAAWLMAVEEETMAALLQRGEALGQELSQDVVALRTQIAYGDATKKWAGISALTTRVLFVMAAEGRIVRGRPRGSWTSSQHRWAPRQEWLPLDEELPAVEAQVDLARAWLGAYGPATASDLKWWTGWTMGDTRRALAGVAPIEVEVDGGGEPGLVLPGDEAAGSGPAVDPWAALLPALDSTVMGWAEREWFLGGQTFRAPLFDRSGNPGPTVWWDGHVVGAWAQRKSGEIVVGLLRDVGRDGQAAIDQAVERLAQAIGEVRVTPRFRTPLEMTLAL